MLNNEVYMRTSAEVCSQVASYFQIVDNCIADADTNHTYAINPQTSYSPSPPIQGGSHTSVIISPNTHNTADIYNGFIRVTLKVHIKFKETKGIGKIGADTLGFPFNKVWFGFKDARDAVEKYEIVANGMSIYTQNFGCEESFITACCSNEVTKRADVYSKTRHKDVWNGTFGKRCGVELTWGEYNEEVVNIPLKIDLRRFLPLSNIKYLPAFAGKIELRLYFSTAAMVYCPVGPSRKLRNNIQKWMTFELEDITNEFTPINEPITMWTHADGETEPAAIEGTRENHSQGTTGGGASPSPSPSPTPGSGKTELTAGPKLIKAGVRTFYVDQFSIEECQTVIPCFGIRDDVYNMLVQRYSSQDHPLTFPTQTISFFTTTRPLKNINDKATITITPRFVDSIFCLFPLKHTHKTYFKNPQFEHFQLNCGGYGNIPVKTFGTKPEYPEFIEYCQNAMNVNSEQTGFNKEVTASLVNGKKPRADITGNYPDDRSSFFIGFPTETDGTYQQGLTSLAPINFEMIVSQSTEEGSFAQLTETPPLLGLLLDASISILVLPNGMPPKVVIGAYDITTPGA